ncbi:MAG TPA: DUF87 domain-containing protein [Candidatus Thermoplasmatota archaeon]|nr:DUF87 domain-containing protein [Candidatus Thermoplasmatota archaeon]
MQDHLGSIYGTVGESRFRIVAAERAALRRGDYVKVNHEEGVVLCQILGVTREAGAATAPERSLASQDRTTADAVIIGYRDPRGVLQAPKTPFRPGERVHKADELLIERVLGLTDDGALLGHLRGTSIPVRLDVNHIVQKHTSVLAKTGAGKSYIVGVLMEELLKRGIPIVIIDPHGEHGSLGVPNVSRADMSAMRRFGVKPRGYAESVVEYSPDPSVNKGAHPLRLDGRGLGMRELSDLLGSKVSSAQFGILHQALKEVASRKRDYTLQELIEEAKNHPSSAKWNLVAALEFLDSLRLFHAGGTPIAALAKRGQATIVNLRGIPPDVQEIVVTWLAKGLFEARKLNRVPPLMLVVEEAHHFCPERGFQQAMSGDPLRTIASEGRKFGLGLLIVSQRPAKIDKNVLSQCGTQLILKVTNPNDLKAIIGSVEGLTSDTEDEIQQLPVGCAIVSHPRFAYPLAVDVRPRETRHGGRSVNVLGHWAPQAEPTQAATGEGAGAVGSSVADGDAIQAAETEGAADGEPEESEEGTAEPEAPEPAIATAEPSIEELVASHVPEAPGEPPEPESPRAAPAAAARSRKRAPRAATASPPRALASARAIEVSASESEEGGDEEPLRVEDDSLEYHAPVAHPAAPEEAPAFLDLRRIGQRVLRADLEALPPERLIRLKEELRALAPTVLGLEVEFPRNVAIAELREEIAQSLERTQRALARARRRNLVARIRRRAP